MLIDTNDKRLGRTERKYLLQVAARLAREDAKEQPSATEIYARLRTLPDLHHQSDRGDL
jgi:hypothetical protein